MNNSRYRLIGFISLPFLILYTSWWIIGESFNEFIKKRKRVHIPKDWDKYATNKNIIGSVFQYEDFEKVFKNLNFQLNLTSKELLSVEEFNGYQDKSAYRPNNISYKEYYDKETNDLILGGRGGKQFSLKAPLVSAGKSFKKQTFFWICEGSVRDL